jgi:hypothetical protein
MNRFIPILIATSLCVVTLAGCGEKQQMTNVPAASSNSITSSSAASSSAAAVSSKAPAVKITDAKSVADALKADKLPISNVIVYTEKTDTNSLMGRPNQYTSKVNFADTRAKQSDSKNPVGGSIEVFNNESDAKTRYDYVNSIVKSGGSMFSQYLYLDGNILLRIDGALTSSQAKEYQTAFKEIMK